jgi:hypothetical protein
MDLHTGQRKKKHLHTQHTIYFFIFNRFSEECSVYLKPGSIVMPVKRTEKEKASKKAAKNTSATTASTKKKTSAAKSTTKSKTALKKTAKKTSPATKKQTRKAAATTHMSVSAGNHENVSVSAYYRWEQRGRIHGFDVEDWLQAEKEMKTV